MWPKQKTDLFNAAIFNTSDHKAYIRFLCHSKPQIFQELPSDRGTLTIQFNRSALSKKANQQLIQQALDFFEKSEVINSKVLEALDSYLSKVEQPKSWVFKQLISLNYLNNVGEISNKILIGMALGFMSITVAIMLLFSPLSLMIVIPVACTLLTLTMASFGAAIYIYKRDNAIYHSEKRLNNLFQLDKNQTQYKDKDLSTGLAEFCTAGIWSYPYGMGMY